MVNKIVVNLRNKKHQPGISYVIISRVKIFQELLINQNFNHNQFKERRGTNRITDIKRRAAQSLLPFNHITMTQKRADAERITELA